MTYTKFTTNNLENSSNTSSNISITGEIKRTSEFIEKIIDFLPESPD